MKPAPFKYVLPRSLAEALERKAEIGDEARFLAGGQSLIPTMNFRLAQPGVLIDLNGIGDLPALEQTSDGGVRIGALVRHREVERNALVARSHPIACEAEHQVAHPQIRNRGTLCGNLAHGDPASEMPAVMVALRARLQAQSVRGARWIDADDFFLGVFTTALDEDEMLTAVELPGLAPGTGGCFLEVARRQGDYAMAGVAVMLELDGSGRCAACRVVFCSLGEAPVLAEAAGRALIGEAMTSAAATAAGEAARAEVNPTEDVQAGVDYKRQLAAVLTRRAVLKAAARARPDLDGA